MQQLDNGMVFSYLKRLGWVKIMIDLVIVNRDGSKQGRGGSLKL